MIKEQHDKRIEVMFALYNIPADWPEELQWHQLALWLAAEAFAGCRTLERGLGGPTLKTLRNNRDLKRELLEQFDAYQRTHPGFRDLTVATNFLKLTSKYRAACHALRLRDPKSLAQAIRSIRKENGSRTEAQGS
jgi:hypothetical protein